MISIFLINRTLQNDDNKKQAINAIQKIGQHPSYGDLNIPKIKIYSRVLLKEDIDESLNESVFNISAYCPCVTGYFIE